MANYNSGFKYNNGYLYNARIQYVSVSGIVTASGSISRAASFIRQLISSLNPSSIIIRHKSGTVGNANTSISSSVNKKSTKSMISAITPFGLINRTSIFLRQLYSNISISGVLSKVCIYVKFLSSTLGMSSILSKISTFKRTTGNAQISILSSINRHIKKILFDNIASVSSSINRTAMYFRYVGHEYFYNKGLRYNAPIERNGNVQITGEVSKIKIFIRAIVANLHVSSGLTKVSTFKRVVGNVLTNISSVISKTTNKYVSDGIMNSSNIIKKDITKPLFANMNISGIVNTVSQFYRSFTGTLTPTKSLLKLFGKNFKASVNISSTFSKVGAFYRNLVSNITPSSAIEKLSWFFRTLSSEVTISSILSTSASFIRSIGNSVVTSSSGISKSISKFIYDTLIISKDIMEFVGNGIVSISTTLKCVKYYFLVTLDGILKPLGVRVLRDSYVDIIPSVKNYTEEIPGKHGEVDFGSELNKRLVELHVITDEMTPEERENFKRQYSKHIVSDETRTLIFESDMDKAYEVKYAGKINPTDYPYQTEFVIPFKMSQPLIESSEIKQLIGSGVLTNDGNFETPLIIEVEGFAMYPKIIIGDTVLEYTGNILAGQKLIIDTEKRTAKIGSTNVLHNFNGEFPLPQPGSVNVIAENNVTIRWRDKYL